MSHDLPIVGPTSYRKSPRPNFVGRVEQVKAQYFPTWPIWLMAHSISLKQCLLFYYYYSTIDFSPPMTMTLQHMHTKVICIWFGLWSLDTERSSRWSPFNNFFPILLFYRWVLFSIVFQSGEFENSRLPRFCFLLVCLSGNTKLKILSQLQSSSFDFSTPK